MARPSAGFMDGRFKHGCQQQRSVRRRAHRGSCRAHPCGGRRHCFYFSAGVGVVVKRSGIISVTVHLTRAYRRWWRKSALPPIRRGLALTAGTDLLATPGASAALLARTLRRLRHRSAISLPCHLLLFSALPPLYSSAHICQNGAGGEMAHCYGGREDGRAAARSAEPPRGCRLGTFRNGTVLPARACYRTLGWRGSGAPRALLRAAALRAYARLPRGSFCPRRYQLPAVTSSLGIAGIGGAFFASLSYLGNGAPHHGRVGVCLLCVGGSKGVCWRLPQCLMPTLERVFAGWLYMTRSFTRLPRWLSLPG